MELDRAYVINGDDLRIALAELVGKPIVPSDAAEHILRTTRVAGAGVMSRGQLTEAVRRCEITHAYGNRKDADWIAGLLLEAIAVPKDESASRDPWAPDDDQVVDVHIHCEHAPESRAAYELGQADQIVGLLGRLPERHAKRVLRWAWDYLTDGDEPPF